MVDFILDEINNSEESVYAENKIKDKNDKLEGYIDSIREASNETYCLDNTKEALEKMGYFNNSEPGLADNYNDLLTHYIEDFREEFQNNYTYREVIENDEPHRLDLITRDLHDNITEIILDGEPYGPANLPYDVREDIREFIQEQYYQPQPHNFSDIFLPDEVRKLISRFDAHGFTVEENVGSSRDRAIERLAVVQGLKEQFGLSDMSCETVINLDNADLLRALYQFKEKHGIPDEFITTFSDSKAIVKYHEGFMREFGLSDDYLIFSGSFRVVSGDMKDLGVEDANEMLYKEGLEILEGILKDTVSYDVNDDTVMGMIERKKAIGRQIGELKRNGEDASELLEQKKRLEQEMGLYKKQQIIQVLPKSKPNEDELKEALSQLSQHFLTGKTKDRAEYISRSIRISEDDDINSVEIGVWNKSLENIPTYEEFRCCAFLGSKNSVLKYMDEASVQLLSVKTDGKTGMAITVACKDAFDKKVLLVDSVESADHMFARKDVVDAVARGIRDYAKKAGFDYIVYNSDAGNNAPREFLANLDGEETDLVDIDIPDVYLEYCDEGIRHDIF